MYSEHVFKNVLMKRKNVINIYILFNSTGSDSGPGVSHSTLIHDNTVNLNAFN